MLSYQLQEFGRPLSEVLRDTPAPAGSEVVLRIGACGVCHSDVHMHDGYFSLAGEGKLDLTRSLNPPRTLGHEICGVVEAVGPDAKGVAVGDRRVAYPWIGCGTCAVCAQGHEELCGAPRVLGVNADGGFATHVRVPDARYLFDPGTLPDEQACTYACAGLTAYAALKKVAPLTAADTLLVVGAGGVGLSGIRMARAVAGPARVIAVELDTAKWPLAREAGADECIDPRADGAARALMKATGGGVSAAIDFVGSGASFAFALAALKKGGTLVCVGLMGGATPVVPMMLAMKAVTVRGSYVGTLAEMGELMALARAGGLPPQPVQRAPLASASQALDALREGRTQGRTVLVPDPA